MRLSVLLRPAAWVYARIMRQRNRRFDRGKLTTDEVGVPVVSVGNISVGGTGKTPMSRYLLQMLREAGMHPALLSRGYGRKTRGFLQATPRSTADEVGDEPLELYNAFNGEVPVAVCEKRVAGARQMLKLNKGIDCIVLDDAYQHRYIHRDVNLLLTDLNRLYTRDKALPEGRLRELPEGAQRADIIVVTKCPENITPRQTNLIERELMPQVGQKVYFTSIAYEPLFIKADKTIESALIVAGIANPQPLIRHWSGKVANVKVLRFGDHHRFTADDIKRIAVAAEHTQIVITTDKDHSRLKQMKLPQSLSNKLQVQHIGVKILHSREMEFRQDILEKLQINSK